MEGGKQRERRQRSVTTQLSPEIRQLRDRGASWSIQRKLKKRKRKEKSTTYLLPTASPPLKSIMMSQYKTA